MRKIILTLTIALTLAGTLLVPAQSVYAADAPAPVRDLVTTNDNNEVVTYTGTWTHNEAQTGRLFEDDHTSATTSDYVQLIFSGTSISLVVTTGPQYGEAQIYIDTVLQETVDLYSVSETLQHVIYNKLGLSAAAHTIKVVVKGTKNASSTGYDINVDAFRFTDLADAPPPGSNEIQCNTQPTGVTCTQVTSQHITIVAVEEDDHSQPAWHLNTSGIGTIYARMTGIDGHWQTNAYSGSGTATYYFDVRTGAGTGEVSRSAGTYSPNRNVHVAVAEITTTETVSAAGNYQSGTRLWNSGGNGEPLWNYWTSYVLELQTVPFANDCIQQYAALNMFGPYVIDPTAEFPALGEKEQVIPVTGGSTYMVRVGGDGWHDASSTDKFQAQYYVPTYENPDGEILDVINAACMSQTDGFYKYTAIIQIPIGGVELHMRVKDVPGDFADNYMDANEHYVFTISEASLTGALSCQEQFSYDVETDLVAFEEVFANQPYTDAIEPDEGEGPLVNGQWYAMQISTGSWQDDGSPPDRYDAQFSWGNVMTGEADGAVWRTFGSGGTNVYCATYDGDYATIYVQAEGGVGIDPRLWLRVNDEEETWTANTGSLFIDIYSAEFERVPSTCETTFGKHGLIGTSEIPANAEQGITIGIATSLTTASFGGMRLTPGAWYMLETEDGPWGWLGSTHSELSYALQVMWGGEWTDLASWAEATCNIAIDAVGHRRLYFQAPAVGATEYKFRVADTATWFNNIGFMRIELFGAYDMISDLPDGSCDYEHDVFPFATVGVNGNDSNGSGLGRLSPEGLYAIQVEGNPSWSEQSGGAALYDTQISVSGTTGPWYDLPTDYGGVLCYYNDGTDLWLFMQGTDVTELGTATNVRVASETFSNNTGAMTVSVYHATAGDTIDPWASCLGDLGVWVLDDYIPIDVRAEDGQYIPIETAWTDSNNVVGFLVKIDWNGGNYWLDGETETQHRDAALSKDNAATWGPLDPTNAEIVCATKDVIGYASAYFQIADGDQWKIRVNDVDTATFGDNGGQLAYKLYAVTTGGAVDCIVDTNNPECIDWTEHPSGILIDGVDICEVAILQPVAPTGIDVPEWLNYVAGWVVYAGQSIMAFGAWCPRHNEALASILEMFKNREPFATLAALDQLISTVRTQADAYNWGDTSAEPSGLEQVGGGASGGGDVANSVFGRLLALDSSVGGPWMGGPLITRTSWSGSIPYSDCVNDFSEFMQNDGLVSGLCFVSSNVRETGAFYIIQLTLDISAIVLLLLTLLHSAQDLINTMAGGSPAGDKTSGTDD